MSDLEMCYIADATGLELQALCTASIFAFRISRNIKLGILQKSLKHDPKTKGQSCPNLRL